MLHLAKPLQLIPKTDRGRQDDCYFIAHNGVTYFWPESISLARFKFIAQHGATCRYCGLVSAISMTVEHLIPKGRGGSNMDWNKGLSCVRCNTLKGCLTEPEFLQFQVGKNYFNRAGIGNLQRKIVPHIDPSFGISVRVQISPKAKKKTLTNPYPCTVDPDFERNRSIVWSLNRGLQIKQDIFSGIKHISNPPGTGSNRTIKKREQRKRQKLRRELLAQTLKDN